MILMVTKRVTIWWIPQMSRTASCIA